MLPVGDYVTASGSEMRVKGKHGGVSIVAFDWLEEGGCVECEPQAYDQDGDLVWDCNYCGGGRAKLFPAPSNVK